MPANGCSSRTVRVAGCSQLPCCKPHMSRQPAYGRRQLVQVHVLGVLKVNLHKLAGDLLSDQCVYVTSVSRSSSGSTDSRMNLAKEHSLCSLQQAAQAGSHLIQGQMAQVVKQLDAGRALPAQPQGGQAQQLLYLLHAQPVLRVYARPPCVQKISLCTGLSFKRCKGCSADVDI